LLEAVGHAYPSSNMRMRFEDIADWLLEAETERSTLVDLTHQLVQKIEEVGVPLSRLNLGVLAQHPELAGYAVHWEQGMDKPVEAPVRHEQTLLPIYLNSPIRWMVETREPTHFDLEDPESGGDFPVISAFRSKGHTDYRGFPIAYGLNEIAALTVCTKRPGGFEKWEIAGLTKLFPAVRLLIEVVEMRRLAKTLLRTYLGRDTAELVLAGRIRRGQGETIQAAIWLCDLRGFTAMTETIGSVAMIEVMNLYFDCMAEAVWENGGEILKFMGDAMLVVFRITDKVSATAAARQSVRAAISAQQQLFELSSQRIRDGLSPLHAGIAVHLGGVVYGNIGAKTRLDFTVMGAAVNLVARLQSLTGRLGEPLLFSHQVAEHLAQPVQSVGEYSFKGVEDTVEIFRVAHRPDSTWPVDSAE